MRKRLFRCPKLLACLLPGAALTAAVAATAAGEEQDAQAPAPDARPVVEIVTDLGPITVELRPDRAPRTVANFLALVDERFYDGLVFHRVIAGFMVQAGGFDGDRKRRPAPRTVPNESVGGLGNEHGTVAWRAARTRIPPAPSSTST